jgi:hypothetical protein
MIGLSHTERLQFANSGHADHPQRMRHYHIQETQTAQASYSLPEHVRRNAGRGAKILGEMVLQELNESTQISENKGTKGFCRNRIE